MRVSAPRRSRRLAAALTVCSVVSASLARPAPARADDASDARDLFARARDLRGKGDCAGALPLFRKAYEAFPSGLGSLRNVAVCEEQLGHAASAHRAWLDLKRALLTTSDPKYQGWSADADAGAARNAPKVSSLTIDLVDADTGKPASTPDPYVVMVNTDSVSSTLLGTPLERDAGEYTVGLVRVAGSPPSVEERVKLRAGEAKHVTLKKPATAPGAVVTLAPAAAKADVIASPEAPETHDAAPAAAKGGPASHPLRTAGWVAIGVGGASLVGAVASLIVRQSALDDLEASCPQYASQACRSDVRSAVSRGQTASTLVDVFGAIGIVGVATGVVLVAAGSKDGGTKSEPSSVSFGVVPGGASLSGRF